METGVFAAYQIAGILEILQVIRGRKGAGIKDFACQAGEPHTDALDLFRTVKLFCDSGAELMRNAGLQQVGDAFFNEV